VELERECQKGGVVKIAKGQTKTSVCEWAFKGFCPDSEGEKTLPRGKKMGLLLAERPKRSFRQGREHHPGKY